MAYRSLTARPHTVFKCILITRCAFISFITICYLFIYLFLLLESEGDLWEFITSLYLPFDSSRVFQKCCITALDWVYECFQCVCSVLVQCIWSNRVVVVPGMWFSLKWGESFLEVELSDGFFSLFRTFLSPVKMEWAGSGRWENPEQICGDYRTQSRKIIKPLAD